MSKGFFVPNSVSSDYVSNKKTSEGTYQYEQSLQEVGLGQQAALQSLNKQYSATVDNAYTNYLSASRGLRGSGMGQNYKQAYMNMAQQNLQSQMAEINLSAGSARQQLAAGSQSMIGDIQAQFQTEVANMDRVSSSLGSYMNYLKTLSKSNDFNTRYLTEEQEKSSLDTMYETLYAAQPQDYIDEEGNMGMTYAEWVNSTMKDTEKDKAWSQWLFGEGGFNQFKSAVKNKGVKKL